eukprot:scaffold9421_cov47-Attheya_sp.AAC.7
MNRALPRSISLGSSGYNLYPISVIPFFTTKHHNIPFHYTHAINKSKDIEATPQKNPSYPS